MRFSSKQYRSLNEAINNVQDPQYYTTEEYTEILEDLVEALCEELDVDPNQLLEDFQTPEREQETAGELRRALNKKNKKVAESVESAEYTELLESVLLALCEELELDPNELLEDYQTPERADQTDRLRMRTRKAAQSAARKYEQAKSLAQYEKESPKTYGSKGRVVKPTKKMLKTRGASEKTQETKRTNEINKYRILRGKEQETNRKNAKTPQGRAIRAASIAYGQRKDLDW